METGDYERDEQEEDGRRKIKGKKQEKCPGIDEGAMIVDEKQYALSHEHLI